ncbi:sigma 54-interacting transcriptional regulator [Liquorilactobacillus mali]|uniref:sigma 54-interacting transcriptional regulator n=1 Tax=Liquorilactobacillus mali TaxID=1618 RepID=UPI002952AB25|nr:sigma 54-interacting transcriptional regulator [Liquorilactobacillus mali]
MNYRERVLLEIKQTTMKFCNSHDEKDIIINNANYFSEKFNKDRSLLSKFLNQLVVQKIAIKINTRPTLFLDKKCLQKNNISLRSVYESIQILLQELDSYDPFVDIIGYNESMRNAIRQAKTSLEYPRMGLPIIIFGESGVGKSFFAQKIYEYAIQKNFLKRNVPLITINCSQYANNPELLSSALFGYIAGAFTGANTNQDGAFLSAEGGILFLDEVHRLSGAGQEKLFTYLDQGYYTKIGSNKPYSAHVRIICATTESKDKFLNTFLRRIPIKINIPDLSKRSPQERKFLVNYLITQEAKIFQRDVKVSGKVLSVLTNYSFSENIGQLKNTIKYMVANANRQIYNDIIDVKIDNLPEYLYSGNNEAFFTLNSLPHGMLYSMNPEKKAIPTENDAVSHLLTTNWNKITNLSEKTDTVDYLGIVKETMDYIIFNRPNESQDMLMAYYLKMSRRIMKLLNQNELFFDGNLVYGIATFAYYNDKILEHGEFKKNQKKFIENCFSKEMGLARSTVDLLVKQLNCDFTESDILWLAIYLSTADKNNITNLDSVGIILAHGYSTASSLANITNRILRANIFSAINMPIEANNEDIIRKLKEFIDHIEGNKRIILLIDMGSLQFIADRAVDYAKNSVMVIDKVTTSIALELGNDILLNKSFEDVRESINETWNPKIAIHHPVKKMGKAILTVCLTGIGTAQQIKKILDDSIPARYRPVVIATDFSNLQRQYLNGSTRFSNYDILGVVGTDDPKLPDISFISLQELMTGTGNSRLNNLLMQIVPEDMLPQISDNLVYNMSLPRVLTNLTILDTDKVMSSIHKTIHQFELGLGYHINNKIQLTLYIHCSNMIERLIRNEALEYHSITATKISKNSQLYSVIKFGLSVIERNYKIKIPDSEIAYIIDIFELDK